MQRGRQNDFRRRNWNEKADRWKWNIKTDSDNCNLECKGMYGGKIPAARKLPFCNRSSRSNVPYSETNIFYLLCRTEMLSWQVPVREQWTLARNLSHFRVKVSSRTCDVLEHIEHGYIAKASAGKRCRGEKHSSLGCRSESCFSIILKGNCGPEALCFSQKTRCWSCCSSEETAADRPKEKSAFFQIHSVLRLTS